MHFQPTLLYLATLLAATTTSALPNNNNPPPKKYPVGETAIYPGIEAKILGWQAQHCPASDKPSYYQKVTQEKCYKLPKTEFLSYKLWQPVSTPEKWTCTFTLYEDADCTGFYVAPTSLPSSVKSATCDDGLRHENGKGGEGFRSFRFGCECSDFYGCALPNPSGH